MTCCRAGGTCMTCCWAGGPGMITCCRAGGPGRFACCQTAAWDWGVASSAGRAPSGTRTTTVLPARSAQVRPRSVRSRPPEPMTTQAPTPPASAPAPTTPARTSSRPAPGDHGRSSRTVRRCSVAWPSVRPVRASQTTRATTASTTTTLVKATERVNAATAAARSRTTAASMLKEPSRTPTGTTAPRKAAPSPSAACGRTDSDRCGRPAWAAPQAGHGPGPRTTARQLQHLIPCTSLMRPTFSGLRRRPRRAARRAGTAPVRPSRRRPRHATRPATDRLG